MYQQMKHDIFKKISSVFGLLSFIFVFSTCYVAWEEISFYGSGVETKAEVVGFESVYKDGRKLQFPIVSYFDLNGSIHRVRSNLATVYSGNHKVGESYDVVYNNSSPDIVRENSIIGLFGKLVLLTTMTYFNFLLLIIFNYYLFITPRYNTKQVVLLP